MIVDLSLATVPKWSRQRVIDIFLWPLFISLALWRNPRLLANCGPRPGAIQL